MTLIRTSHLIALFLAALVVRLVWVPRWDRLVFDGHEATYLKAFHGADIGASTSSYPAIMWIYKALGTVTNDPRALIVFSAIVGALGVVGLAVWVCQESSSRSGILAGCMAALLPEHVLWSTSAYNVILPNTLLVWAFALRGKASFFACFLAAMGRVETVLLAPFSGWRGALGAGCGVAVAVYSGVTFPQMSDGSLALDFNLPMLRYLGPPVLILCVVGWLRGGVGLFAIMAAWVHLSGAAFEDYGGRHALMGGMCLVAMIASARSWFWPVLTVGVLGFETIDAASRWHAADDGTIKAEAIGLPAPPKDCVEVTEEPVISGQSLVSHVAFYRGELDAPCVMWGEEFWHRSWSSRGLMDRARRMRTLYVMKPVGALIPKGGGPVRVYHQLERRW